MFGSYTDHPINILRSFFTLFCKVMPYLEAMTALTVPIDAIHITEAHRHTAALTTDDIHPTEEDMGLTDENMVKDMDHATDQVMDLCMPLTAILGDADHFVWLVNKGKSTKK